MNCSVLPKFFFLVLRPLLTSHSSLLLQISLSVRPHGINQYSFLVYLLGLHNRFTVTFWTSLLCVNLSAYYAFVPSFCPSGYDFAIPSSRLHLTMQTLGVAFGLVGNYLPADFHRRALICPSYAKNSLSEFLPKGSFFISYLILMKRKGFPAQAYGGTKLSPVTVVFLTENSGRYGAVANE